MLPTTHAELVEQLASGANTVLMYSEMSAGFGPWRDSAWGWGFGFLFPVFWLLVLITLIGAVVYFLSNGTNDTNPDQALALLRERYARGEIEEEEFKERASRLRTLPSRR